MRSYPLICRTAIGLFGLSAAMQFSEMPRCIGDRTLSTISPIGRGLFSDFAAGVFGVLRPWPGRFLADIVLRSWFQDVQGVEKLFKSVLENIIIPFEVDRILKYSFTQDATLVFVQKSSYKAFMRHSDREALFWPVRGKNSSGEALSQMLKKKTTDFKHLSSP